MMTLCVLSCIELYYTNALAVVNNKMYIKERRERERGRERGREREREGERGEREKREGGDRVCSFVQCHCSSIVGVEPDVSFCLQDCRLRLVRLF